MSLSQTELLVLVAIARLGESAYGVSIREDVRDSTRRTLSLASVYAALDRLDGLGLARSWLSEPRPERGGRARRHYGLTRAGAARVARERESALRMWRGVVLAPDLRR
jgi:PadR family transcriptional regulator, regulatory protein PadR